MDFPPSGLVFLAGANNAGKSAILSAFDVVAGEADFAAATHAGATGPARVVGTFALDDATRRACLNRLGERGEALSRQGVMTRCSFVFESADGSIPRLREVLVDWTSGDIRLAYVDAAAGRPGSIAWVDWTPQTPESEVVSATARIGGDNETIEGSALTSSAASPLWKGLSDWRQRFYHFKALRTGGGREAPFATARRLAPSGANLPAVLSHLLHNDMPTFVAVRNLIAQTVPGVGELQVPASADKLMVAFDDPHQPGFQHNIKELGTGVEQLLLTLVVGLSKDEPAPAVIVIEEPETNLHPAAQRAVLGLLQEWSREKMFVVATHSPILIDWAADNWLYQVERTQGASELRRVSGDQAALLESLGVRLSDVLTAERLLVVEGPSDEGILRAWFPDMLRDPRVAVVHAGGGDGAVHADRLYEWMSAADRLAGRRVLFVRDRDELASEALARLTESPSVYVLSRREIENYLLDDPEAIAAVVSKGDVDLVTAADVSREIAVAAEELRPRIVVNRVARTLYGPRRLMDHKLRAELADRGAGLEDMTDAILTRLPVAEEIRAEITAEWEAAASDVSALTPETLVHVAPGEEVLNAVFTRLGARPYSKRSDGQAIAQNMTVPPEEVASALRKFLGE